MADISLYGRLPGMEAYRQQNIDKFRQRKMQDEALAMQQAQAGLGERKFEFTKEEAERDFQLRKQAAEMQRQVQSLQIQQMQRGLSAEPSPDFKVVGSRLVKISPDGQAEIVVDSPDAMAGGYFDTPQTPQDQHAPQGAADTPESNMYRAVVGGSGIVPMGREMVGKIAGQFAPGMVDQELVGQRNLMRDYEREMARMKALSGRPSVWEQSRIAKLTPGLGATASPKESFAIVQQQHRQSVEDFNRHVRRSQDPRLPQKIRDDSLKSAIEIKDFIDRYYGGSLTPSDVARDSMQPKTPRSALAELIDTGRSAVREMSGEERPTGQIKFLGFE
jgi:hypothetical protein